MNNFKFYIFEPYMSVGLTATTAYRIPGTFKEVEATPVFPLGIGDFLDERLDEAYITVYNSDVQHYKAKTICKVEIYEDTKVAATKFYIIGNDNSIELPVGSGKYKHDLFLIEPTKLLEGIPCQSITFTNTLKANDLPLATITPLGSTTNTTGPAFYLMDETLERGWTLTIPSKVTWKPFTLPSMNTVAESLKAFWKNAGIVIVNGDEELESVIPESSVTSKIVLNQENQESVVTDTSISKKIDESTKVTYSLCFYQPGPASYFYISFEFDVEISAVYPIEPYTITTMTQRCLELARPICNTNVLTPMFSFDGVSYLSNNGVFGNPTYNEGSQSNLYSKTIATEIALTQATLREQLKAIGNLIHAEPRVNVIDSGNKEAGYSTTIGFSVFYEPYDSGDTINLDGKPYVYKALSQNINEYCDSVRTNAKNVVNLNNYAQGTFVDPISSTNNPPSPAEFKSVRSESVNIRITDANGICITALPIYEIIKVECGIVSQSNWDAWATEYKWGVNSSKEFDGKPVDITRFVLEKSAYDLLDNHSRNGKALHIYYTRGQKNISGLFFKRSQLSITQAFDEYAIANILNLVGGQSVGFEDVVKLVFRVTYIPMYNTTFNHGKQTFSISELFSPPYSQLYNQSENIIETRFYGENVKGAAARLGNVECERTYIFDKLSEVPKNGQILDGYTICASNTQMLPTHYKTTLALSKDFNRLNQYVGISQNKRTYEVSEYAAYERSVLMSAKVIISDSPYLVAQNTLQAPAGWFRDIITNTGNSRRQICNVIARGKTKNGTPLQPVILPVVSSSFGNVVTFSWEYKDNFSAGECVEYYSEEANGIKGYWNKDVPYCDDYGRIFSYDFALLIRGAFLNSALSDFQALSLNTPKLTDSQYNTLYGMKNIYAENYLLRKDSREKLSFNVQFEFVTDDSKLIIGSGLASYCDLVSYENREPIKLYLLKEKIGKFDSNIASKEWVECIGVYHEDSDSYESLLGEIGEYGVVIYFYNDFYDAYTGSKITKTDYQSWALARMPKKKDITYINDSGEEETIPQQVGGEILIASNTIPTHNFVRYFKIAS